MHEDNLYIQIPEHCTKNSYFCQACVAIAPEPKWSNGKYNPQYVQWFWTITWRHPLFWYHGDGSPVLTLWEFPEHRFNLRPEVGPVPGDWRYAASPDYGMMRWRSKHKPPAWGTPAWEQWRQRLFQREA
jgi:hypothetical protein